VARKVTRYTKGDRVFVRSFTSYGEVLGRASDTETWVCLAGVPILCPDDDLRYSANAKEHRRESKDRWKRANPEKSKASIRNWGQKNPEKLKAYRQKAYAEHPERAQAYTARWRAKNQDALREQYRAWKKANPDKVKAWREKRKAELLQAARARRAADPELHREYSRSWKRHNREKGRVQTNVYRTRIRLAGGRYTADDWQAILEAFGHRCLHCARHESEARLTVDHVIPVSKGGCSNIWNLQPLCRSCNSRKGAR
jgi:5-methylcytosine-specific restriction endonuclease McrA